MNTLNSFHIRVVCYAGYREEETPRRFYLGEQSIDVAEVLDRWLSPDHRYFKILSAAGDLYILRHDSREDQWELTLFKSGHPTDNQLSGPVSGSS